MTTRRDVIKTMLKKGTDDKMLRLRAMYPDASRAHLRRDVREVREQYHQERKHKTVCLSDIHIPYHHPQAVANVLDFLGRYEPDAVILNGDILDCYSISNFDRKPGRSLMRHEWELGETLIATIRATVGDDTRIEFLEGNHEQRLERLLMKNSGLFGVEELGHEFQLCLDDHDVGYTDYKHAVECQGVSYTHGHYIRKHAGYTAKAMILDDGFERVVIGHTHRMARFQFHGYTGLRWAIEGGGLFDVEQADYIDNPNWQNGFTIVETIDGRHQVDQVSVNRDDGSFWADGRMYDTESGWGA